jgi:hypothetical protein
MCLIDGLNGDSSFQPTVPPLVHNTHCPLTDPAPDSVVTNDFQHGAHDSSGEERPQIILELWLRRIYVALSSSRLKEVLRMCWIFRDALTVLVERPQIAHGISTPAILGYC